ncbi:ectoine hydroxylase [Marinobacter nanhaiticus D15-8W]|uniref:Ectoine hydroxylase n=1 Tax=Marinobacter nanhaiticus D15-8W TaxID=626887 RepID=N6WXY4_9GAMM|nr:ectoine hydroxylase [Marinobacter nanhaiticus]ENO13638.2 ectoine hydroxylase [Marinobacter nanhaiticus D15-8W]BES71009.1 ectoine hydroxylase [Marinobacter nanhaiticus D15-8W]
MTHETNPYPSRLKEDQGIDPFVRLDPVVHSRNQWRWDGPLDEMSLSRYERDGFLWFEGFFSQERMQPFFDELKEMAEDKKLMESQQIIKDPESGEIRSVFAMHEISDHFNRLTRDPRILGMVRQLLGSEVYIHQSRINDKFGFQGSGFDWHSDFETWHSEDGMPRMRAVSASLMLTDNNEFNGPLMLIPGSHHYFVPCIGETPDMNWTDSLKAQRLGVPDQDSLAMLAERGGIQAPKGPAGSLLLFECNTLHASNKNMSPWPRSNLFFVYNSVENQLEEPYAAPNPRPEFLGARENTDPLTMHDDFPELAGQGVSPLKFRG